MMNSKLKLHQIFVTIIPLTVAVLIVKDLKHAIVFAALGFLLGFLIRGMGREEG